MEKYIYCNQCNAKNDSFNEFCTECGKRIDDSTAGSHTVYTNNTRERVMSGSFDALPGAPKYGKERNKTKNILSILAVLIFGAVAAIVFWQVYENVVNNFP